MLDTSRALKNPLVRNYLDSQKKAVEAVESGAEDIGRAGLEKFKENCRAWLGGLWDEIEPGEYYFTKEREGGFAASVKFIFHFNWQGVPGMITSHGWGRHSKISEPWAMLRFFDDSRSESMRLRRDFRPSEEMSYSETAHAIDDFELGAFLFWEVKRMEDIQRQQKDNAEAARKYELRKMADGFGRCDTPEQVKTHHDICLRQAPDEWVRWDECAAAAVKRMSEIADEKRRIEEENARWDAEEERLLAMAEKAFLKINVLEITCAVLLAAGEQDPDAEPRAAEKVFYAYSEQPDRDGWYTCLEFGRERKVKLRNIIAIAQIHIDKPGHDLVSTLYAHKALRSEIFSDLSVNFWSLPGQKIPTP